MTAVLIPRVNLARLAAGPAALAVGLGALAVAQGPGRFTTYAGRSGLTATLTVVAGLALVVAGLVTSFSRPAGTVTPSTVAWSSRGVAAAEPRTRHSGPDNQTAREHLR